MDFTTLKKIIQILLFPPNLTSDDPWPWYMTFDLITYKEPLLHLWPKFGSDFNFSNKVVLEPRVLPVFLITYFCNHCNIRFDPIPVKVICANLLQDHYVQVPWKYITVYGYSQKLSLTKPHPLTELEVHMLHLQIKYVFFQKLKCKRSLTPRWPLTQVCWGYMCDSTQGSLCPSPMKIHQSMWIQWPSFKNLNQSSLIPRWPFTPHLLRLHVWLYPRITVSKSHGNTSMYVDTVINFAKYHIHTTYRRYTYMYRMSDHIVSFWTQFRRDKKTQTTKTNIFHLTWSQMTLDFGTWPLISLTYERTPIVPLTQVWL